MPRPSDAAGARATVAVIVVSRKARADASGAAHTLSVTGVPGANL
jgi:hypothetical protein